MLPESAQSVSMDMIIFYRTSINRSFESEPDIFKIKTVFRVGGKHVQDS